MSNPGEKHESYPLSENQRTLFSSKSAFPTARGVSQGYHRTGVYRSDGVRDSITTVVRANGAHKKRKVGNHPTGDKSDFDKKAAPTTKQTAFVAIPPRGKSVATSAHPVDQIEQDFFSPTNLEAVTKENRKDTPCPAFVHQKSGRYKVGMDHLGNYGRSNVAAGVGREKAPSSSTSQNDKTILTGNFQTFKGWKSPRLCGKENVTSK